MNRNRPPRILIRRLTAGLMPVLVWAFSAPAVFAADEVSKLAGQWNWTWKDPAGDTHRHSLDVEGIDTKLAARERFDDQPAVKVEKLTLDGKKVRFAVVRGQKRSEYEGALEGEAIKGTVTVTYDGQSEEFTWKATREKAKDPARKP